ncbi:hypothetical protein TPB0596_33790 [Tsukamurella pulmonis]|uniref:hypothetical protein n=1 Tax=Tsukamurella pulmonis TaxID=47312 RepID=UPI001EDF5DC9|nr:hypothetical protein [Tsukamurella pulmonis]BDD83616.1 hypothetical protein TPB0596_33790 [Tsukamurella pulmonis]
MTASLTPMHGVGFSSPVPTEHDDADRDAYKFLTGRTHPDEHDNNAELPANTDSELTTKQEAEQEHASLAYLLNGGEPTISAGNLDETELHARQILIGR